MDAPKVLKDIENIKEKDKNVEIPTFKMITDHGIRPPSLFRVNEFTIVFQEIVNTYGVPTYKEVNPSVFACVTFPFLFGIMFGDMGHGLVLLLVGAFLCIFDGPIRRKAPGMAGILTARYIVLLMGIFATYCGVIYNDFMAIPIWAFESCYDIRELRVGEPGYNPNATTPIHGHHNDQMAVFYKKDCVYPVGVDPAWYLGKNELAFLNSLKMKISVILGVLQMSMGICMKAFNAVYFKNKLDFFFEFIPQIILISVLFGYMDLMIICKWLTDFSGRESFAPSVITNMINMGLSGGAIDEGTVAVVGSDGFQ